MKVQDIRSFFKSPSSGGAAASSSSNQVVEVPSKLGRKKPPPPADSTSLTSPTTSKKDSKESSRRKLVKAEELLEDDEDPIPRSMSTSKRDSKESRRRKLVKTEEVIDDDDPIPKRSRSRRGSKESSSRKLAKTEEIVIDDDDEDPIPRSMSTGKRDSKESTRRKLVKTEELVDDEYEDPIPKRFKKIKESPKKKSTLNSNLKEKESKQEKQPAPDSPKKTKTKPETKTAPDSQRSSSGSGKTRQEMKTAPDSPRPSSRKSRQETKTAPDSPRSSPRKTNQETKTAPDSPRKTKTNQEMKTAPDSPRKTKTNQETKTAPDSPRSSSRKSRQETKTAPDSPRSSPRKTNQEMKTAPDSPRSSSRKSKHETKTAPDFARSSPRKTKPETKTAPDSPRKTKLEMKPIQQSESPTSSPKKRFPSIPKESKQEKKHVQEALTSSLSSSNTNGSQQSVTLSESMWVDKYRPKLLKNLVGPTGDKSNPNKLLKWLQNWFQYHGKSDDKAKTSWPGLKDPEGKTFKAVLLSGPPGIGKTTMAHLACEQLGLDYVEYNASDTRNKKCLHQELGGLLESHSLQGTKKEHDMNLGSKHVLIMDEVDGMSGNEDRGGMQELIALIKSARVPIICICNDRNHQKIRSLANYCFDLRCYKPTVEQLKGFIQSVCFKEKMKLPYNSVIQLVKSTDFDIRQIVNQLELLNGTNPNNQTVYNPRKDLIFGPWDVCRKVFSSSERAGMSIHDKNNLFFQDYSFGPLFIQENYLKWKPHAAKGSKYKTLDLIKAAAESIATGELVETLIRKSNNWSLLPTQAIFSSILPGEYMEGSEVSGIEFPRWLGKNSNRGKMSRLLQQLHTHVHLQVSGSLEALNLDYLPYLRRSIVNPLANGDVDTSVQVMQDYNLMREDLDNINELAMWTGMRNPFDKLESKTKAAFTRQVNKEVLPYSVIKVTKGRGKKGDEVEGLENDDEIAEDEDEEEETVETDAMIKKKKKKATTTASSSKASSSKAKK